MITSEMVTKLKSLLPVVFLFLSAFFGLPTLVSQVRASAGLVCIADPSFEPTTCPSSPPDLIGSVESEVTVAVNIQGSDSLNAFDISVQVDPTVLQPVSISLANSLIQDPRVIVLQSVNSTTGVARLVMAALGYVVPSPVTGNLFGIVYRVLSSNSGTSIAFGGCGVTGSTCVELANPGYVPVTLQTASFGLVIPDFLVSASSQVVQAGFSVNTTIVIGSIGEFNNPINFSLGLVPQCQSTLCPSVSLNETTIALSPDGIGFTTLTFSAPPEPFDVSIRDWGVNVTGTSGGLFHSVVAAFTVLPPDFSIDAAPSYQFFRSGSTANATIVLHSIGGLGTVNLTVTPSYSVCPVSTCPSWGLSSTSLRLSPNATARAIFTVSAPPAEPNATVGYWGFRVRATSGTLYHDTFAEFAALPPADFSLSVEPLSLTIERGPSTCVGQGCPANIATVDVSGVGVSLSTSISPDIAVGPRVSLENERYGPLLLVLTNSTTHLGTYIVTVAGSNGWFTHTTTLTVIIFGAGGGCSASCQPHRPIIINRNGDFNSENGVTEGSGNPSDPYIIQDLNIAALSNTPGISIRNTTAYFVVRNTYIHSIGCQCYGITMTDVANGALEESQIAVYGSSLALESSRNILVSGSEVASISIDASQDLTVSDSGGKTCYGNYGGYPCYGGFVVITSSDNVTLARNTFSGFQILDSTRVIAENNTLSEEGISITGTTSEQFDSHTITPDNTVNGRPLLFYKDCSRMNLGSVEPGELIVANCAGFKMDNLAFGRYDLQIEMAFVREAVIENITALVTIHVLNSTDVEFSRVNLRSIDVESTTGIRISDAGDVLISSSTNAYIFDNAGTVRVVNSSNVTISGSPALGFCDCTAVSIQDSSHVRVSANHIAGEPSMVVRHSSFVEISDNQVTGVADGAIFLSGCSDVSILRNRLGVDESGDTVAVSECERVSISENTISPYVHGYGSFYLLEVSLSNNVTITGNNLSNSTGAVRVSDSSDMTINSNDIQSNVQGVVLNGTMNIQVFHNNFLNNTVQAGDTYSTGNVWDNGYPNGGNYWSDYTGVDNCTGAMQNICSSPDGLGDTPYSLSFGKDRYPLMRPFASTVTGAVQYNPSRIVFQHTAKYLTIIIEMPSGVSVANVIASSLRLNDTVSLASGPAAFQIVNSGREVMVKFPMTNAKALIPRPGNYVLQVSGNILTATNFRPFVALASVRFVAGG